MASTKEYVEGYRITRQSNELLIEVLDYHARPLRLSISELAELGMRIVDPVEPITKPKDKPTPVHKPKTDPAK